jgi:N-methylhydantoinase A
MQSNGGLIDTEKLLESLDAHVRAVGGSVGSLALSAQIGEPNLICTDMGGTSFDVSLVIDGKAAGTSERKLGGLPILAPMVDIHTIGAGGGSVAWNDSGSLRVGPRSAGAMPGPACYGRGGTEPTVTDANLVLGRVDPDGFLGGAMRLSRDRAEAAIDALAATFGLSRNSMAEGIVDVVNSQMANAIRSVTVSRNRSQGIRARGVQARVRCTPHSSRPSSGSTT